MAVKEILLGILTLGPAYGLQLHSELCVRAPHRARTNVGQIYGTLERLVTAGLVLRSGETTDGLPRYALTHAGESLAQAWLSGRDLTEVTPWPELLDRVLIARSLNDTTLKTIIGVYEQILAREPAALTPSSRGQNELLAAANARFSNAALAWLGDVRRDMSRRSNMTDAEVENDSTAVAHGYTTERPKRGRPSIS